LPLAFLLFLTGCAAYLKSFLPTKMEAREAQQASKRDDADQSDPRTDDELAPRLKKTMWLRNQRNAVPGRLTRWFRSGLHTTVTAI
jgi:hypothetical protein